MRPFLPAVVIGLFAAIATEVQAQYPQVYVPAAPAGYTYVYPTRTTYVRGYRAVAPQYYISQPNRTGYVNRPYYGAYGYGNYSNGSTDGFPPFRPRRPR
jgi:hypothetical protein